MNSIGIDSSTPFFLFEQNFKKTNNNIYYLNLFIKKYNYIEFDYPVKALIYYSSKKVTRFRVKKFNYSIFYEENKSDGSFSDFISSNYYFQMCQGDSPKELYFYNIEAQNFKDYYYYCFFSAFGNYSTYFNKENDIKNISDLDFDKIAENYFYNFDENNGYLKINCTKPAMLKHSKILIKNELYLKSGAYKYPLDKNSLIVIKINIYKEFISGQRYHIFKDEIKSSTKYTFHEDLVNKNLKLKFTLFGLKENRNVKLIFNEGKSYNLSNFPLEINYEYKIYTKDLFYFEYKDNIKNMFEVEVIIGFLPEDLDIDMK